MEKRNPMLKKAFEEAAKKELAALPEERFVIKAYSPEFENKIQRILEEKSDIKEKAVNHKSRRFIRSALVAAVLMCMLVVGVSAGEYVITFSRQWRDRLSENIVNAEIGAGVEEFNADIKKSKDPFAIASLESENTVEFIPDYTESIEYNDVVAVDEAYRFELKRVTKARKKHLLMTGGRLSDGSATYEWTVSDSYFAIIEISRCDGKLLSGEEKDTHINVEWSYLLAGYSPSLTDLHFRDTVQSYCDDYKVYYAVEITDMMPFAGTDLALTAIAYDENGYSRDINKDTVYADGEGKLELVNEDEYLGVLLRFSVPAKYASDDGNYAKKYFHKSSWQLNNWTKSYHKKATE